MNYVFSDIVGQVIDWQAGDSLRFDEIRTLPTYLRFDTLFGAPTVLTINRGPEAGDSVTLNEVSLGGLSGDVTFASGGALLLGNNLANSLRGTARADMLAGFGGDDTLRGRGGADLFLMSPGSGADAGTDQIIGGAGVDLVAFANYWSAGVTVNLAAGTYSQGTMSGIERVTGTGYSDRLTGNSADNELDGRAGQDWLNGGTGNDTLTGGEGIDRFIFDQPVRGEYDVIRGFATNQDLLLLEDSKFLGLGSAGNPVSPGKLTIGADAIADTAQNRLIYNFSNGKLYYDADGSGSLYSPLYFARLGSNPQDLDAGDIRLI